MDAIEWAHRDLVHLVWAAAALCAGLAALELRREAALGRFVSRAMQPRLASAAPVGQRLARVAAIFAMLVCGVLALMRPQSQGAVESVSGRRVSADIMVVLDVSRSMLAEDAAPNRLGRARAEISAMLEQLGGHRVGLIAFAGKAAILAPLTPDYAFFRMMLRGADPASVSRGGTAIGEALRLAVRAFGADGSGGARLILLITDGEDHDSYPREAAKEAADAEIAIVSVGLGSEEGSPILLTDPDTGVKKPLVDSGGQPVVSRVDGELLRDIALATGGAYVPAGTAALDLESIVREHVVPILRDAAPSAARGRARDLYPWPVLGALLFLVLAAGLGAPARRRRLTHGEEGESR
jgi:Ca-activated chloride channel family protein